MKSRNLTKITFSLILTLVLGISFVTTVSAAEVTVDAKIGAKLIFNATPQKLKMSVDPVDKPTAQASQKLMVKTNAPTYGITASYGSFEVKDYGLIENGNLKVQSRAPDSGSGTGDPVTVEDEIEILAGESGRTNNEFTPVVYQLSVDFTVPFGDASTTVVYTATMST